MKNLIFYAFIALGVVACDKHDDDDQGTNEIRLEYKAFHPFQLSVSKGTTVMFNNVGGGGTHSVTGNLFDSGKIKVDDSFLYIFNTVGTYSFYCSFHSTNSQERVNILVQ
jgi:plastocyanin